MLSDLLIAGRVIPKMETPNEPTPVLVHSLFWKISLSNILELIAFDIASTLNTWGDLHASLKLKYKNSCKFSAVRKPRTWASSVAASSLLLRRNSSRPLQNINQLWWEAAFLNLHRMQTRDGINNTFSLLDCPLFILSRQFICLNSGIYLLFLNFSEVCLKSSNYLWKYSSIGSDCTFH